MAIPIVLFFGLRKYKLGSNKGFITFDLILNEDHQMSNEITEHPVEDGSVISDHIKNNLESGSLTALVSNFSVKSIVGFFNRAQDAYDKMVDIWKSRELVTIVTVLRVYEDMGIESISTARSSDTGSSIIFDISFRKVEQVKLRTVDIDVGVKVKGTITDIDRQASVASDVGRTTGKTL